jgi:nicotinate-nucleotide adenylyltransferase
VAVGLLGGAFDPPHEGHVALARAALEKLELEGLLVLVVEHPGHREVAAPALARLELAKLAFAPIPVATVRLDEHSRTVDSLESLRPHDAYFVVGSDELAGFWTWKRPERVLELVRLAVARRPGVLQVDLDRALARFPDPSRVTFFDMPEHPVSSSEVRARLARGASVAGLVPAPVADAIASLGLYAHAE